MITDEQRDVLSRFKIVPNTKIVDLSYTPERTFTTDEANTRIQQLAKGIQNLQLGDTARVAIMSNNSYNYLCLWLALSQLGLTIVPINIKLPIEQVHFCLSDSSATLAFCTAEFKHLVPDNLRSIEIDSQEYFDLLDDSEYTKPPYDGNKINYIMYTSGTTGNPKGVVASYENRMWSNYYGFMSLSELTDIALSGIHVSPLYHLAGTNGLLNFATLANAASLTLVLQPKFNAREYIYAIEKYKIRELRLVAPMMAMILAERDLIRKADLSSVKIIILTSSAAPEKMQREIKLYFKSLELLTNPYGLTESGPVFGGHPLNIPKPINSVGYPLKGIETRIVDGVLQVRSNAILTSYLNRKEAYDNVITEDGFLITGDLFRSNKYGFYFYMGRADDMFKSGGEKIYPSEIESIIDKHPAVSMSAVVGVPDKIKGYKPYAFVQLKPNEITTGEQIKNYAIKNVATYQIPRDVWIVDELPRTTIGKIDRKLLTKMATESVASHSKEI
jgi:acyl-CoA synthetase (AMP-forming)/AMP-acid ligase II